MVFEQMNIDKFSEMKKFWDDIPVIIETIGDQKEDIEVFLKRNPKLNFVCIECEMKKIVGTILCGQDGRRGFIYHLAVHQEYRNRGIAKNLFQKSLEQLKKEGIKGCLIFIKKDNLDGNSFWNKMDCDFLSDLNIMSINL